VNLRKLRIVGCCSGRSKVRGISVNELPNFFDSKTEFNG